ncbi:hypothetical protein C8T65DRAFT_661060 [Cerioporus squamosus]|nr:hypothetical protein C8T65DRAFT_661060 [Cerioporus squamosus]
MPPSMDDTHSYIAPDASDSRSPCPALNALANHGYLWSGIRRVLDLHELARHNTIEHDGSLVHDDALSQDAPYAPVEVDDALLHHLLSAGSNSNLTADSASSHSSSDADSESSQYSDEREDRERARERAWREGSLTLEQLSRAQVTRWRQARPLDGLHTTLARGEVALLFSVLGVREDVGSGASTDTSTVANSCPTLGLGHSDELRLDDAPRNKNRDTGAPGSAVGDQSEGGAEVPIGRPPAALDRRDAVVVPKRFLAQWMGEERLPEGWQRPQRVIGLSVIHGLVKEQQAAAEKAEVFVERTPTPQ